MTGVWQGSLSEIKLYERREPCHGPVTVTFTVAVTFTVTVAVDRIPVRAPGLGLHGEIVDLAPAAGQQGAPPAALAVIGVQVP